MPRFTDVFSNFTGGQVDPSVQARADIDLYKKASKELSNCALRITGGVDRRPGSSFGVVVASGATHTDDWRMMDFVFNDTQKYLVVLTDQDLLVYTGDGSYTSCTVTKTASTPWPNGEIKNIRHTQLGDTMLLFHKDYQPRRLVRTGATTFTVFLMDFTGDNNTGEVYMPMLPLRSDQPGTTISCSNHHGNGITVDAIPTNLWQSTDVGKQFYIEGIPFTCSSVNTAVGGGFTNMVGNLIGKLDPLYRITTDNVYFAGAAHPDDRYKNGETLHEYNAGVGAGTGSAGPAGTQDRCKLQLQQIETAAYNARGLNEQPPTVNNYMYGLESELDTRTASFLTNPVSIRREFFFEEVYNDDNGWPACGTFHEGRLWIAGGDIAPFHVFGSKAGDYYNFKAGENPDDAIAVACTTNNLAQILHLHSAENLQVYTDAGMLYAPSTEEQPLSPQNIRFLSQNQYGSSVVHPEFFDGAAVFVQENEKTVRENIFTTVDKSESSSVSLTFQDEMRELKDMAALHGANERDEQYLFVITKPTTAGWDHGKLAVFHSIREENLRGWVPWNVIDPGGDPDNLFNGFISVVALSNEIFFLMRFLDTNSLSYSIVITKLDFDMTMDGAVQLTHVSGGTVWQIPTAAFNGYLNTHSFSVTMSDSAGNINEFYLGDYVPDGSGQITIPSLDASFSGRTLYLGYNFTATIKPLPISKVFTDGDVLAEVKRTSAVTLKMINTRQLKVDDQEVNPLVVPADLNKPAPVVNGLEKYYTMGWEYEDDTEIVNDTPLNFHLTGIIREVEI